ncbi:MAG TPA: adenylate/guanylate cyclase domain-containing protein, partial [Chitinophagaceae bacterium]|nr:adenylate/guanylate cyclase domain-containing protein [Chitinophagaceae bacterium]
ILSNIANVYAIRGSEEKALEYALRSLTIAEKLGNKLRVLSSLNAVAIIYYGKNETKDKALEYLLRALPLAEELNDSSSYGTISENIGEIYSNKKDYKEAEEYFNRSISHADGEVTAFAYNGLGKLNLEQGKYPEALNYHQKALKISEELESKPNIIKSLDGIGNIYAKQNDFKSALEYYKKAAAIGEELKLAHDLEVIYDELADTYFALNDYKNAFKYKKLYSGIKDTLYTSDIRNKLGSLQFDFDMKKKDGEITLLAKDKALTDQTLKRQKLAKNAFLAGLILAFIIALLIFRGYRVKVKTNKILDKQKDEIEHLLLNILPKEVANELQRNGVSKPRHFQEVSILFTDFKGFTSIADKMSPGDLVEELNECFIAFDGIIEKYDLEKIKTIGDAYMCAGNIPSPDPGHARKIIKAALDIQEFVERYNVRRAEKNLEAWEIRIGVHIGPVVAGVVGKKKYAYDIWGSAVNIASRMESNGTPGKVNISADTYEIVQGWFECSYRGKIYAKNLGDLDMYYVEYEKSQTDGIQIIQGAREKQYQA